MLGVVERLVEREENKFLRLSMIVSGFLWVTHVLMPCGHYGPGAMVDQSTRISAPAWLIGRLIRNLAKCSEIVHVLNF